MNQKMIKTLQAISISLIWVLFTCIAIWIFNLIKVAYQLKDAEDASVAISIVAIPVFFLLASVLTYVFIGLQKGRKDEGSEGAGQADGNNQPS